MIPLKKLSSFIKFEHSLFSLPLLFAGALLAPQFYGSGQIPWTKLGLIVLAGTGVRAAALALNRLLDRKIDALNPRTLNRELVSGAISPTQAWTLVAVGTLVYLFGAATLGGLCLKLSPIPLIVFSIYPLMKRFTWTAHFGVGLALALAPLGGYIGIENAFPMEPGPWWLAAFTFCWVSGFDILYATLDEAFDRKQGLHSIPATFQTPAALDTALMLHALAFFCLSALRWASFENKGPWIWLALAPAGILLALEQRSGYSLDNNSSFFRVNAWVGVAVFGYVLAGIF